MDAGRYTAKITVHALSENSNGKPEMAVVFEVTEGEARGQTITWWGAFSEAALPYTKEKMQVCDPKWDGLDVDKFAPDGNLVRIKVVDDTYNGKTKQKVGFIDPIDGGSEAKRLEPTKAATLKRNINAMLAGRPAPAAARPAAPKASPPAQRVAPAPQTAADDFGGDDDEVPF